MADVEVTLHLPDESLVQHRDQIWNILQSADPDFVPSLSSRDSTTTKALAKSAAWIGPVTYFEFVMRQPAFLAEIAGRIVGLSSFIPHYDDEILAPYNPSTYVTTTVVKMAYRRQGVGLALNHAIENLTPELASPFITRRTWSTNISNITLLTELGFDQVARVPDDRGPGIDTIYFARATNAEQ